MRRIAAGPELWFEKPGYPPAHCIAKPATPVALNAVRAAVRPKTSERRPGGQRRGLRKGRLSRRGAHKKMLVLKRLIAFLVSSVAILFAGAALAETGQPHQWEVGLQAAATPVMEDVVWFHNFLLWVIAIIVVFVLALLVIIILKFNAKSNPVPSRTTHNTLIEVVWTVVPVLILVAIAVPSFRLLFYQLKVPAADVTVKATGKQWFWSYSYPDAKIEFDSLMKQPKDLKPGEPRLLAVDNSLVVPVNKVIRVITTGADVIHS